MSKRRKQQKRQAIKNMNAQNRDMLNEKYARAAADADAGKKIFALLDLQKKIRTEEIRVANQCVLSRDAAAKGLLGSFAGGAVGSSALLLGLIWPPLMLAQIPSSVFFSWKGAGRGMDAGEKSFKKKHDIDAHIEFLNTLHSKTEKDIDALKGNPDVFASSAVLTDVLLKFPEINAHFARAATRREVKKPDLGQKPQPPIS